MTRDSAVRSGLTLAVLLLSGLSNARAQGATELRGRVLSDSGMPIAGATVTLTAIRYTVRTDSLGRFLLSGTPGATLELAIQSAGFRESKESVVLARRGSVARDFALVSEETPLPEVNPSDRVLSVRVLTRDGEPIAYSNLQINGGRRFVSDDSGRFAVPIMINGRASLLVRRIGFEPTELILTGMPDTAVQVRMNAVARTLETQVITVRSPFVRLDFHGFYRRMVEVEKGARVGYFVTPEDLAMRNPQNVTDAVEQFPSIRLRPINDCPAAQGPIAHGCGLPLNRKMRIEDRAGCPLTVYLDGIRIQPSIVGLKPVDEEINTLVQPHVVAGIEVYPRGVGAPAEYQPYKQGGCGDGVVLIWTK